MRILPPILMATLLAACMSASDAGVTVTRQEIQGGDVDTTTKAVVGILTQLPGGSAICSGTLIAPNLILTAQHCVATITSELVECGSTPFGARYDVESIYVTTNTQLSNEPSDYTRVGVIITPPGGNDACGNDIALLVLREPISPSVATPVTPRVDIPASANEIYSAIGYGHIGDANQTGAGTRRSLRDRHIKCVGDACPLDDQTTSTEFAGSDGTCQGDSGGAALDSRGRVLGALSRGPGDCAGSIYSSVYAWSDWLREQALKAAESGKYAPPAWATLGISEVSTDDGDGDTLLNADDNCPSVANADQADDDRDGVGDLCDNDLDGDGVLDESDNCTTTPNPDQQDRDSDRHGDICDADDDGDGIDDPFDDCPTIADANQADENSDGIGDACAMPSICDRYNPESGLFDGCAAAKGTDVFVTERQPPHIVGLGHAACATGDPTAVGLFGFFMLSLLRRR